MMTDVEFFKYQAKLFLQDAKLYLADFEKPNNDFSISPEYKAFNDDLFLYFEVDYLKHPITLMNAQHFVAEMAGFRKWGDLIKASPDELKLARLVYKNCQSSQAIEDWKWYLGELDTYELDPKAIYEIATKYFEAENNYWRL